MSARAAGGRRAAVDRGAVALLAAALLALTACTALPVQPPRPGVAADAECLAQLAALDEAVDAAGVRDAENTRLPAFPALRVNRLLAAQAPDVAADDASWARWIEQLRALDEADRRIEAGNLPPREQAALAGAIASIGRCSPHLAAAVAAQRDWRAAVRAQARVPDRYRTLARAAGLYVLTRWPFAAGVQRWQADAQARLAADADPPGPLERLVPAAAAAGGVADAGLAALFDRHAPVLDVEQRGDADRIGTPAWGALVPAGPGDPPLAPPGSGPAPRIGVDTTQPVVYQRATQTLVQGRLLTQLVWTAWFPERPPQGAFDLLAGRLDGIVLRLTLAPDGTPWMLDTMHTCGCWHQFFPAAGVQPRPAPDPLEEWAYAPVRLPVLRPGERLAVTLSAGEHQVVRLRAVPADVPGRRYARRAEDELRRLPWPPAWGGGTRSLYGADGLVDGTERGERLLFWPMGIASAGAMRQWGHHATAFVGRRHFDDADLLDRRFRFPFDQGRGGSGT